ncbi:MAG: 2-isopropylmalate synthase [Actinomycetia bacterium]|nr:2-isopropylmalate synthase [Actinomycetes bacterium]MCP5031675.1 2-isopropylmalate synthase [Actinomycetes bacterium]
MSQDDSAHQLHQDLLYDWNLTDADPPPQHEVEVNDETLRDGLQCPSVRQPRLDEKIEVLHTIAALGIDAADLGYPSASPQMLDDVVALLKEIDRAGLDISANCAGRTAAYDIYPMAEAQQRSGVGLEAALFLGSSPIRQAIEGWDIDFLVKTTVDAVTLARGEGLEVMFVTEDTSRADPDDLRQVYLAAIEAGARRICLSDTVGHATPGGVRSLVEFTCQLITESGEDVKLDWHGHRDRGLDVINSLVAISAGAHRVHGCGLGIGERVGNTAMEVLLVNLKLLGWIDTDLSSLPAYCDAVSRATDSPIPHNLPAVGEDAFRTSTGVHAAAVLKAIKSGDTWLANRVYSGVPADELGREQIITVGPMSGQANAVAWLTQKNLRCDDRSIKAIMAEAKTVDHVLSDDEIYSLLGAESE